VLLDLRTYILCEKTRKREHTHENKGVPHQIGHDQSRMDTVNCDVCSFFLFTNIEIMMRQNRILKDGSYFEKQE